MAGAGLWWGFKGVGAETVGGVFLIKDKVFTEGTDEFVPGLGHRGGVVYVVKARPAGVGYDRWLLGFDRHCWMVLALFECESQVDACPTRTQAEVPSTQPDASWSSRRGALKSRNRPDDTKKAELVEGKAGLDSEPRCLVSGWICYERLNILGCLYSLLYLK